MTVKNRQTISWGLLSFVVVAILTPCLSWKSDVDNDRAVLKVNDAQIFMLINKSESQRAQDMNVILSKVEVMNVTLIDLKIEIQKLKDKNRIK